MNKSTSGFTILELLVVISIIGILTTIGVLSYSQIQANTRNHQRSSRITVIAEALEKYYDQNGEYPSCAAMTKPVATVASTTLKGVDANILAVPTATSGTNSILPSCADLTTSSNDAFAYVGDGSADCLTGQDCMQWTLKYKEEGTSNIVSVASRHKVSIATAGDITNLAAVANSTTQITLTWSALGNSLDYTVQRATNSIFTSNLVQTTASNNSSVVTGLTTGTTYYFRVRANFTAGVSDWSNTDDATTTINTPATPTVTASTSSGTTTYSWGSVYCDTGATAVYQYDYSISSGYDSGWYGPTTSLSSSFTTSTEGNSYVVTVQSRCQGANIASTWSGSGSASYYRPITIPTISLGASSTSILAGTGVSLSLTSNIDVGPTIYYLKIYNQTTGSIVASTGSGASLSYTTYPISNQSFVGQVTKSDGTVVASSNVVTVYTTPLYAPGAPAVYQSTSGGTTTFSWTSVSCQSGSYPVYYYDYSTNWGYNSGWVSAGTGTAMSVTSSSEGYTYYLSALGQCVDTGTSSAWGGSGSTSYFRPVNGPGGISIWVTRGSGSNTAAMQASSSCTGGATLDDQNDVWTGTYPWTDTGAMGWWADSHGGAWLNGTYANYGNPVVVTDTNSGPVASGSLWAMRVYFRCHNYTTGAMSGSAYGQSGQMSLP